MMRKVIDNKLINAASFYLLSALLFIMLPFLFFLKIMHKIFRHRKIEDCMRGKVVLITGASSGIGEYMAYEYAKREAFLAIVARREDHLVKVAENARKMGSPDVIIICADVSNFGDCRRFVDQTVNHFGRLDHLVNNAGIAGVYFAKQGTEVTKFASIMDINFWGSVNPTYFAIPHLKRTKGKIIVNASSAAYLHTPAHGFYCASKSALVSFFESIRAELTPEVTIVMVTLGLIDSEMNHGKVMGPKGIMQDDFQIPKSAASTMMGTQPCAKAIVDGACRGDRYITQPQAHRIIFLANFLFPEFVQPILASMYNQQAIKIT